MNRGRPEKYSDQELKDILFKYVSKNPGEKVSPSRLEDITGIKRHVWSRRMKEIISKLNQPTPILNENESALPLPNVFELVEKNWNNKTELINGLNLYNETLQKLYEQAKQLPAVTKENILLKQEIEKKSHEIKNVKRELDYYKDLYMKTAVKSTYKSFQEQEGINNVISISNNKKQALNTDLVSQFPGLFDNDDNHKEVDTKITEPNGE